MHQIKFWITWIILASLQTFHVNVFIIHEILNEIKKNVCICNERETTLACWLFGLRNLYVSYRSSQSWRVSISLEFILNNLWIVRKKNWSLYFTLLCDIKLDAIKHQFLDEMLIWPPQTSFLFFLLPVICNENFITMQTILSPQFLYIFNSYISKISNEKKYHWIIFYT